VQQDQRTSSAAHKQADLVPRQPPGTIPRELPINRSLARQCSGQAEHGRTKRQVAAMFVEEKPSLQALPLEPFASTSMASARFTWLTVSRWKRLITDRRRAGSGGRSRCSGTRCSCVCLIPARVSCYASI
jgi:hypothetical protein